jgi:hypothetical protein
MFSFKKKKPEIKFISSFPNLTMLEEVLPKPTKSFTPSWWKNLENGNNDVSKTMKVDAGTVKNCPSFPDYFSNGFIVPMWCDVILKYNKKTGIYDFEFSNKEFIIENHGNQQFLDIVPSYNYMNKKGSFVFKFISPWSAITDPGWSILQLPAFYHFNNDFTVLPGIIDTDIYHELNQQVILLDPKEEIFIPRGTPLAQYIPFKREKINLTIREANENDIDSITKQRLILRSQFTGSKQYNSMRRERDKK